jgi:hypothetical protein
MERLDAALYPELPPFLSLFLDMPATGDKESPLGWPRRGKKPESGPLPDTARQPRVELHRSIYRHQPGFCSISTTLVL